MAQYRYSVPEFRQSVVVALAITAMVSGLVLMLLRAAARPDALFWAGLSAVVFFALISAGMLLRYLRNEVVLAVRPTGLYDARTMREAANWEEIRDLVLLRREDQYELEVYLWRPPSTTGATGPDLRADFTIALHDLEKPAEIILRDIAAYKIIRTGPGLDFGFDHEQRPPARSGAS